jgi:hypothetical protein
MERRGLTLGLEREKTSGAIKAVSQLPGHSCTTDHIPSSHNNGVSSDAVCFVPLPFSRASPKKPQPMDAMPSFRHPVAVPPPQYPKPRINSPSGTPISGEILHDLELDRTEASNHHPWRGNEKSAPAAHAGIHKATRTPCVTSLSPGNPICLPLSGQHWTQQRKLRGKRLEGKENHLIRKRRPPSRALSAAETQG